MDSSGCAPRKQHSATTTYTIPLILTVVKWYFCNSGVYSLCECKGIYS